MYDRGNPTVVKFRARLARDLAQLLDNEGPLTLRFTSEDVLVGDESTDLARSHEDNLALPFYRDGIRSITFLPGIESDEVENFLDLVLRASGPLSEEEDLVTLFWDADFGHLDVDYVPTDCDVDGGGGGAEGQAPEVLVPWPASSHDESGAAPSAMPAPDAEGPNDGPRWRSDDWETGEKRIDPEEAFARLGLTASGELERFHAEFKAEESVSAVRCALTVIAAGVAAHPQPEDRVELGHFLPRVLREAIRLARWEDARETLSLLRSCDAHGTAVSAVVSDLLAAAPTAGTGAGTTATGAPAAAAAECAAALERQSPEDPESFLAFARALGTEATPWLMEVLSRGRHTPLRNPLSHVLADLCRAHPDRLQSWLSSPDCDVVRDAVRILGAIGGSAAFELLRTVSLRTEPEIRQDVVVALCQADPAAARPVLVAMLDQADGRLLGVILRHLSKERDVMVSRRLLLSLQEPGFRNRPPVEKRAIYSALGACGGDEVLRTLRMEVLEGGWLPGRPDPHRQALARCLARIGSSAAIEILRRGARSWRLGVRRICADALSGSHVDD